MSIPVIATGGFGDGRGLVAALALGAQGVVMGTRFCATVEAPIHDRIKQFIVANDERVAELGERPGAVFDDVRTDVSGVRGRQALENGEIDGGLIWAGQVQGLVNDVPTCAELIGRIVAQARTLIAADLPATIQSKKS